MPDDRLPLCDRLTLFTNLDQKPSFDSVMLACLGSFLYVRS